VTISADWLYRGEFSFSDFTSDITRVIAERKSLPIHTTYYFESGLDYMLNHFQGDLWPRTISTKATGGGQIPVRSKEEALKWFEQANFLDCKINAYPKRVEWKGINLQAPNFIFIDLDLGRFKSRLALDRGLDKTLKNINQKFNVVVNPTVLWSGNGYHIYLPVEAFVLEQESEFARFGNPSRKFIQFAEPYLSNNKSDPEHTKGLSFKNSMVRIPGSFNAKHDKIEVKIIRKWDGSRPSIKPLLFRFDLYLLVSKSKEFHEHNKQKSYEPRVFSTVWKRN
jgi:hypothetical protein